MDESAEWVAGGAVTRDDVIAWVTRIESVANDPEQAHGLEDDLFRAVLTAIAGGAPDAQDLAILALYSLLFDFRRDCGPSRERDDYYGP